MSEIEQSMTAAPDAQPPAEAAPEKTDSDRVTLLQAKNLELKEEKQRDRDKSQAEIQALKAELQKIKTDHKKAKQSADLEAGNYESAFRDLSSTYEQAQAAIAERDAIIEKMKAEGRRSQIKTEFIRAAGAAGAINPDHLLALKEGELQLTSDGQVRGFLGGVETELPAYIEKLKQGSDAYMFKGSGAQGMSAAGSTPTNTGGLSLNSMSYTEQLHLRENDPELYARLKASAG
nr:phage minor structural protein GP20 [uncultured Mediterranean phage uvMED]